MAGLPRAPESPEAEIARIDGRKIALVWDGEAPLDRISFRFEHYLEGFRALGHQPVVVCRRDHATSEIDPVLTVESRELLLDPGFWRRLGADVAVMVTWLRRADLLRAISAGGTRTVAISDSDGLVGLRAHPAMTLRRMLVYKTTWRGRLGCIKYWLGRLLTDGSRGSREDRSYLASVAASDAVTFVSPQAIAAFRRFLAFHRAESLADRLRVVPYAVPESFCHGSVREPRDRRLVAIGRWSDPQKDSELLARGLEILLAGDTDTEVEIFGFDAEAPFGALDRRFPNLHLRGPRPPAEIRAALESAQALVFTSRWETGPHTATEALALGTTLTGTAIPNLEGFCENGRFGSLTHRRSPTALAAAIRRELDAWSSGARDPLAIAATWRARLRPESVGRQLLATLES